MPSVFHWNSSSGCFSRFWASCSWLDCKLLSVIRVIMMSEEDFVFIYFVELLSRARRYWWWNRVGRKTRTVGDKNIYRKNSKNEWFQIEGLRTFFNKFAQKNSSLILLLNKILLITPQHFNAMKNSSVSPQEL